MKNWIEKEQREEDKLKSLKKDLKIDDFICTMLLQREVDSLKKAQNFRAFGAVCWRQWSGLAAAFGGSLRQ